MKSRSHKFRHTEEKATGLIQWNSLVSRAPWIGADVSVPRQLKAMPTPVLALFNNCQLLCVNKQLLTYPVSEGVFDREASVATTRDRKAPEKIPYRTLTTTRVAPLFLTKGQHKRVRQIERTCTPSKAQVEAKVPAVAISIRLYGP